MFENFEESCYDDLLHELKKLDSQTSINLLKTFKTQVAMTSDPSTQFVTVKNAVLNSDWGMLTQLEKAECKQKVNLAEFESVVLGISKTDKETGKKVIS